jgi:two-component system, OmpR family, sensor histidine kinase PrrB
VNRNPSIRLRVTVAATAAVALVLIAAAVLTVATFASRERSSLDRDLERRAAGPAGEFVRGGPSRSFFHGDRVGAPGEPPPSEELLAESGSFVRVLQGDTVLAERGDAPDGDFPLPDGTGFETVDADGGKWRTLTVDAGPRGFGSEAPDRLQFAASLAAQEDRISALRNRMALVSGFGVVLAALIAWLFAQPALRPLRALRNSVARVSTTRDLANRLPEGDAPEEVNEVARSVNGMLGRLEQSSAETERALSATRRFAADAGHELRTPLTSIRANFDALRRNPDMPETQRRRMLDEMSAEQLRLVSLLDSLQALARGDAAEALPRERLDLGDTVDAAITAARARHPGAAIELRAPDGPLEAEGWPDGLRLLTDNLIENALRHGGSRVLVTISELGNESFLLSVEDDGPGIPPEDRERIFDPFVRGAGTKTQGSGLGLALVAQQAAIHGGRVDVSESTLGGAAFRVVMPVTAAPREAGHAAAPETEPRRSA